MMNFFSTIEKIEKIIWDDAGGRNITSFAKKNELLLAAQSLQTAKHVVIVSGFYIEKMKTGETDGPLGTVILAQALERLNAKVTVMTSPFNENILQKAIAALNLNTELIVVEPGEEVECFPKILHNQSLTHLVAIEQMGIAIDGNYYNMAGNPINEPMARFDSLFVLAREKGITTIGIGDGGNEIGMGNLYPFLFQSLKNGWIANITHVNYIITAGVSNWGAYGLVACMSCLNRQVLLHEPIDEKHLLRVIVQAGAVDGKTSRRELSVDGLPLEKHKEIISNLQAVIRTFDQEQMIAGKSNVG
ncbi:DUF4392 domain-containing protein [Calidifontibacillus oryziterrae]|uniref:DUF4392 domain-containing protein n=1 Tax=Calidifontibacillus oryziterrae TaxID=1191699 RepID=UPI0002FBD488|nr:DUF4392 domain-containing protein [Calidifontibacillus oryziterrae]